MCPSTLNSFFKMLKTSFFIAAKFYDPDKNNAGNEGFFRRLNIYKQCSCRSNLKKTNVNHLNPELNPICYLLALLGAHHFLHVSRIRVKLLIFRLLMSYIYGAPILDVSRSHTTTQHSR